MYILVAELSDEHGQGFQGEQAAGLGERAVMGTLLPVGLLAVAVAAVAVAVAVAAAAVVACHLPLQKSIATRHRRTATLAEAVHDG